MFIPHYDCLLRKSYHIFLCFYLSSYSMLNGEGEKKELKYILNQEKGQRKRREGNFRGLGSPGPGGELELWDQLVMS